MEAEYLPRLREAASRQGTLLCLGLDPQPERLAELLGDLGVASMEAYLQDLLHALEDTGAFPAALKPNLACFEQYGSRGLAAMERILDRWRDRAPVILDAKRGDIGVSSEAYARAVFDAWEADAVTVSPWMGRDSLEPFLRRCPERGVYVLLRTSNPGSEDLQGLQVGGRPLWMTLHRLMRDWARPGLGAVVGATRPAELAGPAADFPLLVPGVGTQGGQPAAVMAALRSAGADLGIHRVNVSSAILYAGGHNPVGAAVEAAARYRSALKP